MKNSFVMYTRYKRQIDRLDVEQKALLLEAIMAYQTDEELPEMDAITGMLFSVMQSDFDADRDKYEEKCLKRSEAGKAGGRPRKEEPEEENNSFSEKAKKANAFSEKQKKQKNPDSDNDGDYECDYEGDKEKPSNEGKKKSSRFSAPSVDQVKEYCSERGNGIDAQSFVDFYQRQNWRLSNGVKMSDWKAAVRTWEKRRNDKNTYNNHPEQRKEYGGEIDWTGL